MNERSGKRKAWAVLAGLAVVLGVSLVVRGWSSRESSRRQIDGPLSEDESEVVSVTELVDVAAPTADSPRPLAREAVSEPPAELPGSASRATDLARLSGTLRFEGENLSPENLKLMACRLEPSGTLQDIRLEDCKGLSWQLTDLQPADWFVLATAEVDGVVYESKPRTITLTPGELRSDVELVVPLLTIEGTVLSSSGMPVPGVTVEIARFEMPHTYLPDELAWAHVANRENPFNGPDLGQQLAGIVSSLAFERDLLESGFMPAPQVHGKATTDWVGGFRMRVPRSGRYQFSVARSDGVQLMVRSHKATVRHSEPNVSLEIRAALPATVTGYAAVEDGTPPSRIDCFLRRGDARTSIETNSEGRYLFEDVWPGTYLFYARVGGDAGQRYCATTKLVVEEGATVTHDPFLRPSLSISGHAILEFADSATPSGVQLTAIGIENRHLTRDTRIRDDGSFTIKGLYPGTYRIQVHGYELPAPLHFTVDGNREPNALEIRCLTPFSQIEGHER